MTSQARGPFEVKTTPQAPADGVGHPSIGRLALDKVFRGDLEATSKGQMLALGTEVKGSAGYVALEVVDGMLAGRRGTFALQHSGTMNRGAGTLAIAVIPDSGTGELTGLVGQMSIDVAPGGAHTYTFTYTLPDLK